MNRRTVLQLAGGIGTVAIAGCLGVASSDADGQETTEPSERGGGNRLDEPVDHAAVAMKSDDNGHHFDPPLVWVKPGGTVTWTNESGAHTATAYHPDADKPRRIPNEASAWDSGMFSESGKTFEHTFDVEGIYDYFCIPHEYRAMVGSIIVGEPELDGQPALTSPQDSLPEEARSLLTELNSRTRNVLEGTDE